MQITAACPKCNNRYQFDAALIGQRIRCTNCREKFEVREVSGEEPPRAAKPARDRRAPTFDGDSSERNAPVVAPAGESPREADWSKLPPPPVRRRDEVIPESTILTAAAVEPVVASADEALAFMGMAPGAPATDDDYNLAAEVVEGEPVDEVVGADDGEADDGDLYGQYGKRPKRRWMLFAFLALFIVGGAAVGGFFMYVGVQKGRQEGKFAGEAALALNNKNYGDAERRYEELVTKYPNGADVLKYRFWRDYSKTMASATDPTEATGVRRKKLTEYVGPLRTGSDSNAELFKEKYSDVHNAFSLIAEQQVKDATRKADAGDFEAAKSGQADAIEMQGMLRQFAPASGPAISDDLTKSYAALAEKITEGQRFTKFVASGSERLKTLTPATVADVEREAKELGYALRPAVSKMIEDAKKGLTSLIVFKSDERPGVAPPSAGLTSLIIGPNIDPIPETTPVIFALARGVLYALAEGKGQILWTARVGIDASSLPTRVPAAGSVPAMVLLPSPDGFGLVAREVLTGKPRWFQRLPAAVRGRPILVEGRIIAPLADDRGSVAVLESRDGQMLGTIELNQRIGAGAALQPGTSRVFVPAESLNVFVLDANPPLTAGQEPKLLALIAVLATDHGPGSLRAEPTIVGGVDDATGQLAGTAYMIIAQSDGFSDMKLRSFTLDQPLTKAELGKEVALPGWAWFAPFCDQEKVATVTDAGALALLGINQKQNQDPPLFPLVVDRPKERTKSGRGQIVHAEENGFWYLANGELKFMQMGFHGKDGLKLAPGWKQPLKLGAPLHAAQVSADRNTLFVVTQTASPPAWLATAVNAQTGDIVWQRALGLAVSGDPVALGDAVFQLDQGAGIYAAQPGSAVVPAGQEWALAGQVLAAPRLDVVGEPYLLPHADGKMAFVIFATGDGKTLNASVLVPGQKASAPLTTTLPATLSGAPVLLDKTLVMPLADGGLHKWVIGEKDIKRGPDWRAPRLGETARALLTLVGKDGILVSDGLRGLTYYAWPNGADHQLKQQLNVPDKIVAAPLVLPAKEGSPRVAVADAAGRLTLFEGEPLAATLKWEVRAMRKGNEITAGPFLADVGGQPRLLVVADRTTLVCLTPEDRREAWSFKIKGDGLPLAPRQIGNALILADVSGRYEAIDLATGQALAGPYPPLTALPAAPAASPIAFGANLFAPLTDGTVLLIPIEALTGKK